MRALGEISERLRRSTAQVSTRSGKAGGSGIVWSSDGLILTNAHVARALASVTLWDGRVFDATVVARDTRRDLASLRIAATGLEAARAGDSSSLRAGELVIAAGNPMGFIGALSTGVVHSVGPVAELGGESWIRTDVRLAPGNSGGPLANARGEVVGINTAILNRLGVALPVSRAHEFLLHGPRPSLGVTLRPLPFGLMILELEADGAAAAASLRSRDVLLHSLDELNRSLDGVREVVRLRFVRGGSDRVREVAVRLRSRAEAA